MEEIESAGGSPISTSALEDAVVRVIVFAAGAAKNDMVVGGYRQSYYQLLRSFRAASLCYGWPPEGTLWREECYRDEAVLNHA
jgi:hypothetical protein